MELEVGKWAEGQWGKCNLGDKRRVARAVQIGINMAQAPDAGMPEQMGGRTALIGAYRLLNNRAVKMKMLLEPHLSDTLAVARERSQAGQVILMIHDGSVLDFSAHAKTQGLGSVGSRRQRGMIMHSVLAVVDERKEVLGLTHLEVIVRPEGKSAHNGGRRSNGPEGQVWENGVKSVGPAPANATWVHVSDRESDVFEYMALCLAYGSHFVVRGRWNRAVEPEGSESAKLVDKIRSLPANPSAPSDWVDVDATAKSPKRRAHVVMSWCALEMRPPQHVTGEAARSLQINVVRVWEPNPPLGAERVEWILLTSLPVTNPDQAMRVVHFYECRWIIEDFHMSLKTGCRYEQSQLDHGLDLQNLLGFAAPIAVRLLQLRQAVRITPDLPATAAVDPLMLRLLMAHFKFMTIVTINQFWLAVARLGGYVGQPLKHPPGWRTIWKGWRTLSAWAEGARLLAT